MRPIVTSPTHTLIICECSLTDSEKARIDRYVTKVLNERYKVKTEKKDNGKNKH